MRDFATITAHEKQRIMAAAVYEGNATQAIIEVAQLADDTPPEVARMWMEAFGAWERFMVAYAATLPRGPNVTVGQQIMAEQTINVNLAEMEYKAKRECKLDDMASDRAKDLGGQ